MLIYQIKLPKKQDPDAFAKFMREEYLPAVHKGPTRVGQVTKLTLLKGVAPTQGFFLHVGWSGLPGHEGIRIDDDAVQQKFDQLGARFQFLGTFEEVPASKTRRQSA